MKTNGRIQMKGQWTNSIEETKMKQTTERKHARKMLPFLLTGLMILGYAAQAAADISSTSAGWIEMTESYLDESVSLPDSYGCVSDSFDEDFLTESTFQNNGTSYAGSDSEAEDTTISCIHSSDKASNSTETVIQENSSMESINQESERNDSTENTFEQNETGVMAPLEDETESEKCTEGIAVDHTAKPFPTDTNSSDTALSSNKQEDPAKLHNEESMLSETAVINPSELPPYKPEKKDETEPIPGKEKDSDADESKEAVSDSGKPREQKSDTKTSSLPDIPEEAEIKTEYINETQPVSDIPQPQETDTSAATKPENESDPFQNEAKESQTSTESQVPSITGLEDTIPPREEESLLQPDAENAPAIETEISWQPFMFPEEETESEYEPDQQTETTYAGSYSRSSITYSGSGNRRFLTGSFRYRKSLTRAQKIENLRVGFRKSADENCALCDAKNWVDVHAGRGTDTEVVGRLDPGDLCYILADADDQWVYIESGNVRGFVFSYYLASGSGTDKIIQEEGAGNVPLAEETMDPLQNEVFRYSLLTNGSTPTTLYEESEVIQDGVSEARASLLNLAASFEGSPYAWGGCDPHTGVDCSGFVNYVYGQFGVNLPRTAEEQAYTGMKIAVEDALPGDLVFMMDSTGYIYHVVIYAGEGKAIEARGSSYGVGCFDLDYRSACWAVRLINDIAPDVTTGRIDGLDYSQDQLELIWAIVAQEDNGSYEGALAVITSAMNRADQNYGGFGQNALAQLTAPGQYCFSPSVSDPGYYQARLGGNVPDYVRDAVYDCLVSGYRNHSFLNFRSTCGSGGRTQIGGNWFF